MGHTEREVTKMKHERIPIGFLAALTESKSAMQSFCRLNDGEKQRLAEKAKQMKNKEDMRVLALSLATDCEICSSDGGGFI